MALGFVFIPTALLEPLASPMPTPKAFPGAFREGSVAPEQPFPGEMPVLQEASREAGPRVSGQTQANPGQTQASPGQPRTIQAKSRSTQDNPGHPRPHPVNSL